MIPRSRRTGIRLRDQTNGRVMPYDLSRIVFRAVINDENLNIPAPKLCGQRIKTTPDPGSSIKRWNND